MLLGVNRETKFKILAVALGLSLSVLMVFLFDRLIFNYADVVARVRLVFDNHLLSNSDKLYLQQFEPPLSWFSKEKLEELSKKDLIRNSTIQGDSRKNEIFGPDTWIIDGKIKTQRAKTYSNLDELVYEVDYRTDAEGRRLTATSQTPLSDTAVVIVGCSHTFGEGLNENATYPYLLSQQLPKTSTYNFGIRGAAANDFLKKFDDNPNFFSIPEKKIILIYSFFVDHLDRESCPWDCYFNADWKLKKPRYELSGSGVESFGTHEDFYKKSLLLKVAKNFKSISHGPLLFPAADSEDAMRLHFALLKELKNKFSQKYQIIASYHVYLDQTSEFVIDRMLKIDQEKNYKPIVTPAEKLRIRMKLSYQDGSIRGNGHPNEFTNYIISEAIRHRLVTNHPQLF